MVAKFGNGGMGGVGSSGMHAVSSLIVASFFSFSCCYCYCCHCFHCQLIFVPSFKNTFLCRIVSACHRHRRQLVTANGLLVLVNSIRSGVNSYIRTLASSASASSSLLAALVTEATAVTADRSIAMLSRNLFSLTLYW